MHMLLMFLIDAALVAQVILLEGLPPLSGGNNRSRIDPIAKQEGQLVMRTPLIAEDRDILEVLFQRLNKI